MARYREIEVAGTPREMGRAIGEAARDEVRGFCNVALDLVRKTAPISDERAIGTARTCIHLAAAYAPHMLSELQGIAEASGCSLDDVMLLQIRNQFRPAQEAGCTAASIAASASATNGPLLAQNWDNDPNLDPFTIVLTRRPKGKPAFMTITQAGLIAYIGMSEAGIGVCLNTLPAPSREVGVPHYCTVRGIFEATGLEEAVRAVARAHRAIPANILLTTPQGPANLEVTIEGVHLLRASQRGVLGHTNHCLHPELSCINDDYPELIQSRSRKARIDQLLGQVEGPISVEHLQAVLRDHDGHPRSICRHSNDDSGTGFWATVFSVAMEPAAGVMYVSRGTPCCHGYEEYRLAL